MVVEGNAYTMRKGEDCLKLAITDMDIVWENKDKNKEQCRYMIEEAAKKKAEDRKSVV